MKRVLSCLLSLALVFSSIVCFDCKKTDAAVFETIVDNSITPYYQKALTTQVNLSTKTSLTPDLQRISIGSLSGTYDFIYSFQIGVNSYVCISYNAKVYNGTMCYSQLFLGENSEYINESIAETTRADGSDASSAMCTTALEAGTYYLRVSVVKLSRGKEEPGFVTDPCVNIGVNAQAMKERTGGVDGSSRETAINAPAKKVVYGNITGVNEGKSSPLTSNSIAKQYFKFTLKKKKSIYYTVSIMRPQGFSIGMNYKVNFYNSGGTIVYSKDFSGSDDVNTITDTSSPIKAGNYYAEVDYPRFCEVSFKQIPVDPGTSESEVATETTTRKRCTLREVRAKIGSKKIYGEVPPGAYVKIRVFKNTYGGLVKEGPFNVPIGKKLKKNTKITITVSLKGWITSKFKIKPKKK